MDGRQERLSSLKDLLRRAARDATDDPQEDYRRKPQQPAVVDVEDSPASAGSFPGGSSAEDWTGTLDLVLRAGERLVASEERVRDLEAEVRELTDSASQEIQELRAGVADLQRQLNEAEAGRRHAEDWLRRLSAAITERFSIEAAQDREANAAQAS